MKARAFLFLTMCGMFGFLLASQAQEDPKTPSAGKIRENSVLQEQILAQQFQEFEADLHKLIIKLKRSAKPGDKERAEVLEKVLETSKNNLVGVQFEQLIGQLKDQG